MKIKTTPTRRGLMRFAHFAQCTDEKRLPAIALNPQGHTAAECFHVHETYGQTIPCREPVLLSRALNGKEWHGVTVTACAEDFVDRLLFAEDLRNNYPDWMQKDILGRAAQISMQRLGFVPTFVRAGSDFTTISQPLLTPAS
jgi:hypothetical protein